MNRLISLLLVALPLAAVSLAQPAQAQWTMGKPYFGSSNGQSSTSGTSITAVINGGTTGHLNITSTPTSSGGGYSTSGSYGGNVSVVYTWTGSNPNGTSIATTQVLEATGAGTGDESGNSNAGGQQAYGDFSHSRAWDQRTTPPNQNFGFGPGVTPTIPTQTVSLGGSISAYYNSYSPGSTIVTADVTFGFTLH